MKETKTREEILAQDYLSAKDIKLLIPTMGLGTCLKIIKEVQEDMKGKYYLPPTRTKIALTKLVRKKLGI